MEQQLDAALAGQEGFAVDDAVSGILSAVGARYGIPAKFFEGLLQGLVGVLVALAAVAGVCFTIFVSNPIVVGGNRFFMENREQKSRFGAIGYVFKSRYGNVVWTMFKRDLFVFLWSLLLVIPGIIKSYAYMLAPYILAENPGMDSRRALQLSSDLMAGHKGDAFVMDLSFLGWNLLSAFTFNLLGIFWVNPYYMAARAELYAAMREYALQTNMVEQSELPGFTASADVNAASYEPFNREQHNHDHNGSEF